MLEYKVRQVNNVSLTCATFMEACLTCK